MWNEWVSWRRGKDDDYGQQRGKFKAVIESIRYRFRKKVIPMWDTLRNNRKWFWKLHDFLGKKKRKKRCCFHNGFTGLVGVNNPNFLRWNLGMNWVQHIAETNSLLSCFASSILRVSDAGTGSSQPWHPTGNIPAWLQPCHLLVTSE